MSTQLFLVDEYRVLPVEESARHGGEVFVRVPGESQTRRTFIDMVFPDRPAAVALAIQHCCDDIAKGYAASQALHALRLDADAPDPDSEVSYDLPDETGMPSPDDPSTDDLTHDVGDPVATFPDTEGSLFDLIHYRDVAAAAPWCPLCRMQCYVLAGRSRCCDKPVVAALGPNELDTAPSAGDIDGEFRPMPSHLEPVGASRVPAFQGG